MKHLKRIDEKGIDLDKVPRGSTYLTLKKKGHGKRNSTEDTTKDKRRLLEIEDELDELFTAVRWDEIKFTTNGGDYFPILPTKITNLLKEGDKLHNKLYRDRDESFTDNWGSWKGVNGWGINFEIESHNFNRTHFPGGIEDYKRLPGRGLGHKLYRALVKHLGYASSENNASPEARRVWAKLASKHLKNRKPTSEDLHVITNQEGVLVIEKGLNAKKKLDLAKEYMDDHVQGTKFAMDDELKKIISDNAPAILDPNAAKKELAAILKEMGAKKANYGSLEDGKFYVFPDVMLEDGITKERDIKKNIYKAIQHFHNPYGAADTLLVKVSDLARYEELKKSNASLRVYSRRQDVRRVAHTLRRLGLSGTFASNQEEFMEVQKPRGVRESLITGFDEFENI